MMMSVKTHLFSVALAAMLLCSVLIGCSPTPTKSVDRQALYVTTAQGQKLLVYEIDNATGKLAELQQVELPGRAGPLAFSDDGQGVYVGVNGPPRIVSLQRDPSTGLLELLKPTAVPAFPTYIDIDATGQFALTASYRDGLVHSFKVNRDRTISPAVVQITKTEKTAHASLIDPGNRFVYIPHTKPNAIYQFAFNAELGHLDAIQPLVVKGGGTPNAPAGPRHYTYHPTLDVVYFVNELDSSIGAYRWDKKTGQLTRMQLLSTLPARFEARNTCADIHVTPDGRFLYASNRGHDTIAAYRIGKDGLLTFIDWFKTEAVPREFAIDLNGQYLYVAGLRTHKLAAYAIDARTGRLNRIGTYDTPEGPIWVQAVELE